jgi:predicted DNA-binding protein with PD1-like motif
MLMDREARIGMNRNHFMDAAFVTAYLILQATGSAADTKAPEPRVFAGARIQEVYRVLLDRDALLLESIDSVIKQKDIRDGEVLVTAGSVQECTYHYVASIETKPKNVYKTVKGPYEILNAGGIIAGGEPHIHITLSHEGKAGVGGHLEKGCRVLYLAEVTIFKYSGPALTRKANENGISLLTAP